MSIATEIQRLAQAKADIKAAIEEKGVEVGDGTIDTFATKISEITGGGGGVPAGYKTVTFKNGDNVLFERLVLNGDDCPDPVTQGRIETPTKESTVQYNYTHSGWSDTDGGTANSNVLKNITEDKVVYSAYSATVVKYTITYYDEDGVTVLHTEQVAYGSVPSYTPTKEGFAFDKWTPTPVAVTGNASYTASWASVLASGTCGDSITWSLSADYIMSIKGTGDMTDYYNAGSRSWDSYKADVTAVVMSDGITSLGSHSFNGFKKITSITIPSTVTSIGQNAFYDCESLTSITIPDSVTSIGNNALYGCKSLASVTIPDSVTSIGQNAFYNCTSLTSITIPDSVTSISDSAFNFCTKLENVTIPNGITSIEGNAFSNCKSLTSVTIPDSVTSIGFMAFYGCNLEEAIFVDTVGWDAGGTALSSSDLANSTTAAKYLSSNYAFKNWTKS